MAELDALLTDAAAEADTPSNPPEPYSVYVLHFSQPYQHAGHVLGVCPGDPADRFAEGLLDGANGPLARAAVEAGAQLVLADVWPVGSLSEAHEVRQALKRRGSRARACSLCRQVPARLAHNALRMREYRARLKVEGR